MAGVVSRDVEQYLFGFVSTSRTNRLAQACNRLQRLLPRPLTSYSFLQEEYAPFVALQQQMLVPGDAWSMRIYAERLFPLERQLFVLRVASPCFEDLVERLGSTHKSSKDCHRTVKRTALARESALWQVRLARTGLCHLPESQRKSMRHQVLQRDTHEEDESVRVCEFPTVAAHLMQLFLPSTITMRLGFVPRNVVFDDPEPKKKRV